MPSVIRKFFPKRSVVKKVPRMGLSEVAARNLAEHMTVKGKVRYSGVVHEWSKSGVRELMQLAESRGYSSQIEYIRSFWHEGSFKRLSPYLNKLSMEKLNYISAEHVEKFSLLPKSQIESWLHHMPKEAFKHYIGYGFEVPLLTQIGKISPKTLELKVFMNLDSYQWEKLLKDKKFVQAVRFEMSPQAAERAVNFFLMKKKLSNQV